MNVFGGGRGVWRTPRPGLGHGVQREFRSTWKWFCATAAVIFFAPQVVRTGWLVEAPSSLMTAWRARELCGKKSDLSEVPTLTACFAWEPQPSPFPAAAAWDAGAISASVVPIVRMYVRAFIGISFGVSIAVCGRCGKETPRR
jgi:hypothetical protein